MVCIFPVIPSSRWRRIPYRRVPSTSTLILWYVSIHPKVPYKLEIYNSKPELPTRALVARRPWPRYQDKQNSTGGLLIRYAHKFTHGLAGLSR